MKTINKISVFIGLVLGYIGYRMVTSESKEGQPPVKTTSTIRYVLRLYTGADSISPKGAQMYLIVPANYALKNEPGIGGIGGYTEQFVSHIPDGTPQNEIENQMQDMVDSEQERYRMLNNEQKATLGVEKLPSEKQ